MDSTTTTLVRLRDALGVDNVRYREQCLALGRCHKHPAYEPDYCPVCGTTQPISDREF